MKYFCIIVVVLLAVGICTFAGVQPMSFYKDNVISKWDTYWAEVKVRTEEYTARAEIIKQKRIEEFQKATEWRKVAEPNAEYVQLFNDFRTQNGELPLTFDFRLNEFAENRAIQIAQPGNFNHEGIKRYNYGENIAMMAYPTISNSRLLKMWATSPGHRSNMLSKMYTRTGFARVGRYAVQIFS